jgi:hypothetical protein
MEASAWRTRRKYSVEALCSKEMPTCGWLLLRARAFLLLCELGRRRRAVRVRE